MYDYSDIVVEEPVDPSPLCQILYSDEFKQLIGIAKALMRSNEHSERALKITERVIEKVAAHYTIWSYRLSIVKGLQNYPLDKELEWCGQIAVHNPKNYQIWHYRSLIIQLILERFGSFDLKQEYPLLEKMLDQDSKNYHVWSYRRWLVERFDLFRDTNELKYTGKMLEEDVRNNSAWNHRFFVLLGDKKTLTNDQIQAEIEYVTAKVDMAPTNPSSWNYLKGIYNKLNMDVTNLQPLATKYSNLNSVHSQYAFELLAEIFEKQKLFDQAIDVYALLEEKDSIRKRYWRWRSSRLSF
ncbi:hypothetical protein KL935_002428 [Ogataea polymorpha]|nr:hypothetical protein KL935_002428 [Ogataea polymorpha]